MRLQIAMDYNTTAQDFASLAKCVEDNVDIIEIGTPMLIKFGLEPVKAMRKEYEGKNISILADTKIIDAGYYEAEMAIKAGADIVTVLGAAEDVTIQQSLRAAEDLGAEVMVDMIAVQNIEKRIAEMEKMGVQYICLHYSKDKQNAKEDFEIYFNNLQQKIKKSKMAVAGGICKDNINFFVKMNPEIIIVGEGICRTQNPGESAAYIKNMLV